MKFNKFLTAKEISEFLGRFAWDHRVLRKFLRWESETLKTIYFHFCVHLKQDNLT